MFSQISQIGAVYQFPPPIQSLQWCKIPKVDLNNGSATSSVDEIEFDRLLPTLFECFVIVFCGFLAGRCNIISKLEIKGLNDFTMYFTLPPLIFLNLVTINFNHVNWHFVLGVLLGKVLVFLIVAVVTAAIHKPTNLSYAGIYGIFCTQGNDFGLAYPVVASLYGSKRPLYPGYMYLIAPTSLLFTNPMGFFLMEIQKNKASVEYYNKGSRYAMLLKTLTTVSWSVLKNPVVSVTILGIVGNFLFRGGLPGVVYGSLQIFSSAFSAAVLFLLGFSVAGCENGKTSNRDGFLIPTVLLIAKMLLSPLVTRGTVVLLCSWAPDVDDLADYGFLYGLVPTGPIVMLFAAEYCLRTEMLASTMVLCTGLFGPVMYILARMMTLKAKGMEAFEGELRITVLVLSVISITACVWSGICFIISKKWKQHIYKITFCLLISQVFMTIGVLLWAMFQSSGKWIAFFEVAFTCSGQLMTRLWTTLLALTLAISRSNPLSPFIQNMYWVIAFGFGIPGAAVLMLLVVTSLGKCEPELEKLLPLFIYGPSEAVASMVILILCLTITVCSLIIYYRSSNIPFVKKGKDINSSPFESILDKDDLKKPKVILNEVGFDIFKITSDPHNIQLPDKKTSDKKESEMVERVPTKIDQKVECSETSLKPDTLSPSKYATKSESFQSLDILSLTSSSCTTDSSSSSEDEEETQKSLRSKNLRHIIYLIISCISMAVGLTISTWKLSASHFYGLFVAIEFLDVVLNVGQGLLMFIVFFEDSKYILSPILKWIRKKRRGIYAVDGKDISDDITQRICKQFRLYHWKNCLQELPKTITVQQKHYKQCFTGKELVDWLMTVGLATHRIGAELYGQRLMTGGILESADGAVQFHDNHSYLYRLTESQSDL